MEALKQTRGGTPGPKFSSHTAGIASEGAAGWAIADAAAEALARGEDVVSLCLGDTSFDTPPRVVSAAIDALQRSRTHYAPVPGTPELRQAIATAQSRFDGQEWGAAEVTVFAGAQNALFAAMMIVAGHGDDVLFLEPFYATYEATIRAGGAVARPVALAFENASGKVSEAVLEEAVGPNTRAILLNSPNNPGGYLLDKADLEIVARFAARHDLWIVSDEVYRSATFGNEFFSIASIPDARPRTIIVNSVSKSHAMTGWRLGWTIAPPTATVHLQNLSQCMLFGSPTFTQDAAAVALQPESDAEMRFFSSALERRSQLMCDRLSRIPKLRFVRPAGGMFCFIDVSATGLSGKEFAENLFRTKGLAVVPGFAFGPRMVNYIRISFSGSEETIAEGMNRLAAFCASLSSTAGLEAVAG
jgi:aspartate/methionine/tyrosine aminotransferase